jgi:hypothetical protein
MFEYYPSTPAIASMYFAVGKALDIVGDFIFHRVDLEQTFWSLMIPTAIAGFGLIASAIPRETYFHNRDIAWGIAIASITIMNTVGDENLRYISTALFILSTGSALITSAVDFAKYRNTKKK